MKFLQCLCWPMLMPILMPRCRRLDFQMATINTPKRRHFGIFIVNLKSISIKSFGFPIVNLEQENAGWIMPSRLMST